MEWNEYEPIADNIAVFTWLHVFPLLIMEAFDKQLQ